MDWDIPVTPERLYIWCIPRQIKIQTLNYNLLWINTTYIGHFPWSSKHNLSFVWYPENVGLPWEILQQ